MSTASNEELKALVKESVKEALEEELIKVRLLFFPEASNREMIEIASRHGKPEKKSVRKETISV